ncbi:unnamed protein product [Rhizoctonia solani]|uniref:F-box domain-containing protein n=1 Tax=Rhizoctonia solani TaxID=456999 RepID=A0A8H2WN67_9AGAM|nr:unnamed protein product [Rhizoctonia solani]
MASTSGMRKGKRTSAVLPRVAIRLIIDLTATLDGPYYIPSCIAESWSHQVWLALHLARVLATLRCVSRGWRDVADEHPTWRTLCSMFDPYSLYSRPRAHLDPTQVPSQPPLNAETFRRIIRATCLVCAVSCPDGYVYRRRAGRTPQTPTYPTPSVIWGIIPACAVHRPLVFCARCLRSEPTTLGLYSAPQLALAPLAANERDMELVRCCDLRTTAGAGVRAVCGACRNERIRTELIRGRGASMAPWMGSGFWDWDYDSADGWSAPWDSGLSRRDTEKLLRSEEVAGVVNQYTEYGDWTVREAIEEMEERVWLRWWTKASEMEGLVRATARQQRMEERAAEPLDTDDESDEEDDLLSLSDEFGLRDMIFQDWARNRILEGIWLSPNIDINQYYNAASSNPEFRYLHPRLAPRHPFGRVQRTPPTLPRGFNSTTLIAVRDPQDHTRRIYTRAPANFYLSNPPPPARLAQPLSRAWETAMRSIIGPAISNIVARIVKECTVAEEVIQAGIERGRVDLDPEQVQHMGIDPARVQRVDLESIRPQCILSRGEPDPCKVVSRIGVDRLIDILRGPEPWVEGGGWEDVYVDWEDADSFQDSDLATPNNFRDPEPVNIPREREPSLTPSSVAPTLRESVAPSPPPSTISAQSPPPTTISAQSPRPSTISAPSPTDQRSSPISTTPSPEALTSPSTMLTTPSPPPIVGGKKLINDTDSYVTHPQGDSFAQSHSHSQNDSFHHPRSQTRTENFTPSPRLPTSPILKKPLHPIPLIPTPGYYLGQQTKVTLEMLWREATGGLWMCRCTICTRAMQVQGVPSVQQPQNHTYAGYQHTQSQMYTGYQQTQTHAGYQQQVQVGHLGNWNLESMHVEEPEVEVEDEGKGKGKGVVGRRSREREDGEERGERKRCKIGVEVV